MRSSCGRFGSSRAEPPLPSPTTFSQFLFSLAVINAVLLAFNLLPIYPLDGGQMLQSLLWFFIGYTRSLRVVSIVGLAAGVGVLVPLLIWRDYWLAILAGFVSLRSWSGLQQARQLAVLEELQREYDRAMWSHQRPSMPVHDRDE